MTMRMWMMGGVLMAIVGGTPLCGWAQVAAPPKPGDVKLKAVHSQVTPAPTYNVTLSAGGAKQTGTRKWLMVDADFSTDPDWVDGVSVKFYVLMKNKKELKMCVGEQSFNSLPKAARHTVAMFLPPAQFERYGNSTVELVGAEVFYDGKSAGQESSPPAPKDWWAKYTPVPGALLPPSETPWAMVAHERFEPPTSGGPK